MIKHSPCSNIAEAKALLNTVKLGIQESSWGHVFPKDIIEAMATENDPFEKIMEDREQIITKSQAFLSQINSLEQIMEAAETGNDENLTYESVGKDFLEFEKTCEAQLNDMQEACDKMKVRLKDLMEQVEKEMNE